ncbi:MAG: hypothetical protein WC326_01835 [Candidatus Delongbacteria bacterium]
MKDDMREIQRIAFQEYLDVLPGEFGFDVTITFSSDGGTIRSFHAGMRVLSATPIFDRASGQVDHWRYWLLFAEMGILDTYGGSHPVHCFECEVLERQELFLTLREVNDEYRFLVCRNDPHSLDERQELIYQEWDKQVARIGGVAALQAILDEQARHWRETLLSTGEMKP